MLLSRFGLRSDTAAALNNLDISIHGVVVSINAFHLKQALESGSIPDGCISFASACLIVSCILFACPWMPQGCTLSGAVTQPSPLCLDNIPGYKAQVKTRINQCASTS